MDGPADHWDAVYTTKATDDVSWFQSEPVTSLRLLRTWARPGGSVVDVGAGTSPLVDRLVEAGRDDVTLLDVSTEALDAVRRRLGDRAGAVRFAVADVRTWNPRRTFDVWHDRAVFHFLVDPADRQAYVDQASAAVAPGGMVVLATFAADGPTSCSGLPTARYDAAALTALFAPAFALEHAERQEHVTPWGTVQPFTWVVFPTGRGRTPLIPLPH